METARILELNFPSPLLNIFKNSLNFYFLVHKIVEIPFFQNFTQKISPATLWKFGSFKMHIINFTELIAIMV
jgi:hypothetical protein